MNRPLLSDEKWEDWDLASSEYEDDDEDSDVIWSLGHQQEYTKLLGGGEKTYHDPEAETEKKLKYPKSVFFIVGNEFCERFSYYGMKAILILFLSNQLLYTEDDATVIYHVWVMLCYFTPILGAIIADAWLGRFKTIFYISIIYVLGNALLSLAAIPPFFPALGPQKAVAFIGLLLIALGTGGIKPCVSAFGGDQFVVPQQEKQLTQFFFIFYFSINSGSLLSTFITPILRDDVHCFDGDCYSLAFGIPAILMFIALVILVLGHLGKLYKIIPPQGSILTDVFGCIGEAIKKKSKSKEKKEHWLDHAVDKYGNELVTDVKMLLRVLLLYIPLPFFWALFDQQGSRWTFQATRMNGEIGSFVLKPDQMQVVNPLFILILIPIFDRIVYPLLAYCNLFKRQLPRIFAGGLLAGLAFVVSGLLELKLETTYPAPIKAGETRVTLINNLGCPTSITPQWGEEEMVTLGPFQNEIYKSISLQDKEHNLFFDYTDCNGVTITGSLLANETVAHVVVITHDGHETTVVNVMPPDDIEKPSKGLPKLRFLHNYMLPFNASLLIDGKLEDYEFPMLESQEIVSGTEYQEVEPDSYQILVPINATHHETASTESFKLRLGGVYNLMVVTPDGDINNEVNMTLFEVTEPNSVHILWLIPQYFIITVSEVMFSITGLEFSFTQAPSSMKSVLQAAWLLTVSFGNLIVVIIAEAKFFQRQSLEFFLFAGLMFVDMIAFAALAVRYTYVDEIDKEDNTKNNTSQENAKTNDGYVGDETKF